MRAAGIDERMMSSERIGADFLVFFYYGVGDGSGANVSSHLLMEADLPSVLTWVRETAQPGWCWSLGVVTRPIPATPEDELDIAWIIGADVFNIDPANRTPEEARLAEEMLSRRDGVDLVAPR